MELKQYFSQLKGWGTNGIGTWFDPADSVDPFSTDPLYRWARARPIEEWNRKRDLLIAAQKEGLATTLCITPNVVYIDQLQSELAAEANRGEYIGPNLCPSNPEARRIILRNCENIFRFLAEGGVKLNYILAALRDFGGCGCSDCEPWMNTFLELWEEISPLMLKYHPETKVQFCTWWVSPEEMMFLTEYLEIKQPPWVDGVNASMGYDIELPEFSLPPGYRKTAFLHISYASGHSDKYGVKGAVVAPKRLEEICRRLSSSGYQGYQAYSEGIFEDLNKFLVSRLGEDATQDAKELVREYCRSQFSTSPQDTDLLVEAIYAMEDLQNEDGEKLACIFEGIGRKYNLADNWRYAMLEVRAQVAKLEHEIGTEQEWEKAITELNPHDQGEYILRLEKLIEERKKILVHLERNVYRVGVQNHVMIIDYDYQPFVRWRENRSQDKLQNIGGEFEV